MTGFNLCEQPWIQVRDAHGLTRLVSLRDAFRGADEIVAIAGELPTQSVAILRLMLAVLKRATIDIGHSTRTWRDWWRNGLPTQAVDAYLDEWSDRFDLRDPERPFYQVAGLATGSGNRSGLVKLIADLPDGNPFFTQRAGEGRSRLSAAEAARWLVHCQAFDPSGIKSGASGDDRVKGGKGYPIGIAWAGWLGLVVLEGGNLRETLLLNLPLDAPEQSGDHPVWERPALGPAVEEDHPEPLGSADLFTWPSRRVLLHWNDDEVVDVQISNGDPLAPHNRRSVEPMTAWRRSPTQEKKLGLATVYMPLAHDPAKQVWRGLGALLDPVPESRREEQSRLRSGTIDWLATLVSEESLPLDRVVRMRTVGMVYGSQSAVIDTVVDDPLDAHVAALTDLRVIALAKRGVAVADAAVQALAELAGNLADATNSDRDSARQRAREQGYAALDFHYRQWFAELTANSEPEGAVQAWGQLVQREIGREGETLVASAGPGVIKGRDTARPGDRPRHMDAGKAWMFFRMKLADVLSLPDTNTSEESA